METEQLRELARQLSHPQGEQGKEVARLMNEGNITMTLRTIDVLDPAPGDIILELGHGNCAHLRHILDRQEKLEYRGLEISPDMFSEAQLINQSYIGEGRASFSLYDGTKIPASDGSFSKVMTVNTLYFWKDPEAMLEEIYRVLRPGGKACICFAERSFMEALPFVQYGFTLYDEAAFIRLAASSQFTVSDSIRVRENIVNKVGGEMERTFLVVSLTKEF